MRSKRRATIQDLRLAVECLPRATRVAMLQGVDEHAIIAGAYTSGDGICPLLAAHRAGARTASAAFARAWDRFVFRDGRIGRPRPATERQLRVLIAHLEGSLLGDGAIAPSLGSAIAEHRRLAADRTRSAPRQPNRHRSAPGDRNRARELRNTPGWAWTRMVRRYDDYQQTLATLDAEQPTTSAPASAGAGASGN